MATKTEIKYLFEFDNGTPPREFSFDFNQPSFDLIVAKRSANESWSDLTFHQCANCPLSANKNPKCPVANNLAPIVQPFRNSNSTEQVEVTVTTHNRQYAKHCTLFEGLSSMVGLLMVTSGCPILDQLRPMAHTHLPFADVEETQYRAIASYLISQAIQHQKGMQADWDLQGLRQLYEDIRQVNLDFSDRLKSLGVRDATINAVVRLDAFADVLTFILSGEWWKDLEPTFDALSNKTNQSSFTQSNDPLQTGASVFH